ncbi:hypothetical protein BGZ92_009836 [Podila epicladia]|nr:hypothetical protein BGZ92_009836 [Podila epicladia]
MSYALSPLNPTPATFEHDQSSPTSHRMSLRLDSGLDTVKSGSELEDDSPVRRRSGGPLDVLDPSIDYEDMYRFGSATLAAEMQLVQAEDLSQAPALLPLANLEDMEKDDSQDSSSADETASTTTADRKAAGTLRMDTLPTVNRPSSLKNRTSSISLLSAELQKATRSDSRIDLSNDGQPALMHQEAALRRLEGLSNDATLDKETWTPDRKSFQHHEKSFSDQGLSPWRQRRRLSEPLHFIATQNSMATKKTRPGSIYSIRRARTRDSPDKHCIHSGHYSSASLGGLPDLQRCKSVELVEQIMTERRNRVLEAWRVGVVAAAVTQQQSIHSIVAYGDQRKDSDNISVRSKMSKMSRMSRTSRMSKKRRHGHRREHGGLSSGDQSSDTKGLGLAGGVSTAAAMVERHAGATELLATTTDFVKEETEEEIIDQGNESNPGALTIDTAVADSDAQESATPTVSRRGPRTPKGKKRQSLLSPKSSRSSLPRSPMARLSMLSNRRFPSEASTASEVISNRRHDQEHTPYQLLHTLSTELLERLARSDTREMNRRLKRTFDIQALSQMSNSVIENVLTDVSNLGERFRWVEVQAMDDVLEGDGGWNTTSKKVKGSGSDDESDSGSDSDDSEEADWDFSVEEFFPLANMVQEMLSEIGKLRMTINELQLSYVQKVEQDRIRAEKDFMDAYGSDAEDAMYEGDDDLGPLERVERTPEKPSAQLKNVLGMLDRPKMTGVSGFFNKVFGGNNNSNNNNNNSNNNNQSNQDDATPRPSASDSRDKPTMSRSKSGVVAETSHVFAETVWISTPGNPEPKTPKASVLSATQGTTSTSTSGLLVPGPRLSATTSLTAMATKSPMRSNTVPVPEKLNTVNPIATRARAMDISFSPGTSHARSPVSASASSVPSILSRSLPKNQFFGAFSVAVSKADTTTSAHQVSSSAISRSSHSSSVVESLEGVSHKVPSTPGPSASGALAPRSIGISTRVSGPALNVVTKQDVFPEQWTTSTSSSLSASVSTVPSTANSDRRVHATDGFLPRKPSRAASTSSASVASSSTGAEIATQQTLKPTSKPTLITRASLTVGTPSASTVSSPISAASWFDSNRNSGGAITTEAGAVTGPDGQVSYASGSIAGKGLDTSTTATKGKALASFHSAAATGGSSESLTRSLGRASGQSAVALLRRETPTTSVLGSIFQGQNQSTPALVSSGLLSSAKASLKGKAVLDGLGEYSKPGLEVLDQEYDDFEAHEDDGIEEALADATGYQPFSPGRPGMTTSRSDVSLPAPSTSLSQRAAVSSATVAYVVAVPAHTDEKEQGKKKPVFDRGLIKASQKRILAGVGAHQENKPEGFVPVAGPRRARALSVDSMQSNKEPLKQNEIMDLWRVGAGVSRDIWNGFIKKVDGGRGS